MAKKKGVVEVNYGTWRETIAQLMVNGWVCCNCGAKLRRPTKEEIQSRMREASDRICTNPKCNCVYGPAST
jgi:uncharacterized protein with PIN domain